MIKREIKKGLEAVMEVAGWRFTARQGKSGSKEWLRGARIWNYFGIKKGFFLRGAPSYGSFT
jgi:hypothetical protein